MKHLDLMERMYDSLRERIGVVIETEDPERLRQRCYALRKDNMTEFGPLSFVLSPINPNHLWIMHPPKETDRESVD